MKGLAKQMVDEDLCVDLDSFSVRELKLLCLGCKEEIEARKELVKGAE